MYYIEKSKITLAGGKLNYITSPMGSGKTTYIKELIRDVAEKDETDRKILILVPYKVSKQEYLNEFDGLPVEMVYPVKLYQDLARRCNTLVDYLKLLLDYYNQYTLIVFDEADFIVTQGEIGRKNVEIEDGNNKVTTNELVLMSLLAVAYSSSISVCVTANDLQSNTNVTRYFRQHDGGYHTMKDLINYIDTGLKSRIKLQKLYIIQYTGDYGRFKSRVIRGLTGKSIVYQSSPKKLSKEVIKAIKDRGAKWYIRDDQLNNYTYGVQPLYKKVGEYEYFEVDKPLDPYVFETCDTVHGYMSIARSVSINKVYENASVYMFDDLFSPQHCQVMGRFRNSPFTGVIITNNKSPEEVKEKLLSYDKYLFEDVAIETYVISKESQYNELPLDNISSKNERVGQRVSSKSQHKELFVEKFIEQLDEPYSSKSAMYKAYCEWMGDCEYKVSRHTFNKYFEQKSL